MEETYCPSTLLDKSEIYAIKGQMTRFWLMSGLASSANSG